ncbi:TniQ family protein [Streptomyces hygroscopicus]|uniref:TniQ family protein n=1 Tax=Streptomyces hygroscopicus TaxID=1912 RepID=UPI0007679543|nr:TniQ family protein [Streptomyces hygroscopicus]
MGPVRTIPLRTEPVAGEALDSWLEALASSSRAPLTQVADALGLGGQRFSNPRWAIALRPTEREHLAVATGVAPDVLQRMTLERWHGRALFIDPQRPSVDRRRLWGRACGSRYCPQCLKESGGRWQLSWRLAFTFACTRHHMLLADTCPACGQIPRSTAHYTGTTPALGICPTRARDAPRERCRYDLRETTTPQLPTDSPLLGTQRQLNELIEEEHETTTAFAGVYGSKHIAIAQVLADLRTLAFRVLTCAHDDDLARWGDDELVRACHAYRQAPLTSYGGGRRAPHTRGSWVAPTDAAAAGLALSAAFDGLSGWDADRPVERLEWFTDRLQEAGGGIAHCDIEQWSSEVSPELVALVLGAVHRSQGRRAVRLHYRSTTGRPRRPAKGLYLPQARAQKMPASLWDTWTLRMMPQSFSGNLRWATVQQALAVSTLQVGAWVNLRQAMDMLGTNLQMKTLSRTVDTLHTHESGPEILRTLTLLADLLDSDGSPINYARRRKIFGKRRDFITLDEWTCIRRNAGHNYPANSFVHHANRWIYQRLTGSPVRMMPAPTTPIPDDKPRKYPQFTFDLHPSETEALTRCCYTLLAEHDITEPLSWAPSIPADLDTSRLAGTTLESVTPRQVHVLLLTGTPSASGVAKALGTSAAHIRCIIDRHPLSRHDIVADRIEKWRQLYLSGRSVAEIAREVGGGHQTILTELRRLGVEIRPRAPRHQYTHLTEEVIHRYTKLDQSLQDIADATGMCKATVRNILEREQVPRRRCGRRTLR